MATWPMLHTGLGDRLFCYSLKLQLYIFVLVVLEDRNFNFFMAVTYKFS